MPDPGGDDVKAVDIAGIQQVFIGEQVFGGTAVVDGVGGLAVLDHDIAGQYVRDHVSRVRSQDPVAF
jgi:hypothetical protein